MKRFFFFIIATLTLCSCIGIESQINFKKNGSGTLTFTYKISQMIKNLDTGSDEKNALPLPVSREEFNRTAEGIEGLKLLSINQREDEENIYIQAKMEFDRIESVNKIGDQINFSLSVEGDTYIFRHIVFSARENQEVSEDSKQMIETFFKGYELSYIIDAPSQIKSYSMGELAQDKKSLTYRITIPELLTSAEDKILEIKW